MAYHTMNDLWIKNPHWMPLLMTRPLLASYDLMCTRFLLHMFCHNSSAQMNRNSVPPLPHEPLIMYDMFLWFDCIHHIKYRVHNESNNENWCINENILLWIKEVVYYAVRYRVSACLYVSVWLWQITWLKDTFSVYLSKICLL